MIPAALSGQLQLGLSDFLRMSFWSSTPGMETVIDRFVDTEGAVFKGPYVSVSLPFRRGDDREFFPELPLGFPAHLHQERAFTRLAARRSTLVATGTGSGKTECFLWPILEHCRQQIGTPGIKAILIYPMNSLATDQALRIARAIHGNSKLRGAVRAGLYIGESPGEKRHAQRSMGAAHVISDRDSMRLDPPDILLTNYKMLDYLLARPTDQELWAENRGSDALRYLVVDELHSFDGAQGTDLACLLRRLKQSLGVKPGELCCVGTSATLGGSGDAAEEATEGLRAYAHDIFGEDFDTDSVITETRQLPAEFFGDALIDFAGTPSAKHRAELDPSRYATPAEYIAAQQALWFDEEIDHEPGTDAWNVALGTQLLASGMLRNLLTLLGDKPLSLDDLAKGLSRTSRRLGRDPELAHAVLVSFLSLVSEARSWLPERAQAREQREAEGGSRRTRPLLEVRLQLWQRELRRMVADLGSEPKLRFSDDLTEEQRKQHLPLVHCRDCGAMGWGTLVTRDRPDEYRTGLERFYRGFFGNDPQVRFLWPDHSDRDVWQAVERFPLDRRSLTRIREEDETEVAPEDKFELVVSDNLETVGGKQRLHRDCPFCDARGSLTLLGFRATTLTAVYIDQLFASSFNDDKKLLTFSDSVQDASHRAGFFGARTWRFNLRVALQQVVRDHDGISLAELPKAFASHWRGEPKSKERDVQFVTTFLPPNMEWLHDYESLLDTGELPSGSGLAKSVERRIAFEIFTEYGHQARIGRSLARTGSSTVAIDPELLDGATDALLEPLQNEIGGLTNLTRSTLRSFLLGALHHLRERGGIHHSELPASFVETAGEDWYAFNRPGYQHLPRFGRGSRLPALLTTDTRTSRFERLLLRGSSSGGSWYERWAERCFADTSTLIGAPADIWILVLAGLVKSGLLKQTDGKRGQVWGLRPEALRLTTGTARIRCGTCHHWMTVAAAERDAWTTMTCLTARCPGSYADEARDAAQAERADYFGRLYANGEVERVFTSEHTGLLTRAVREHVEHEFKAEGAERKPWYPNLLSCTPTLEMGIDIGALSTAILCSVPPAQANYLQRVGRAGRRDGNSLLLTFAQAKPHDLYFYAEPEEMIAGQVRPPGVFLNASAVLERQLAAFTLDQWNLAGAAKDAIARRLREVFSHLDDEKTDHFPQNWLSFVRGREEALLTSFFGLFGERLSDTSREHLRSFLVGDKKNEGSLGWKVLDGLRSERKQCESLRSNARRLQKLITEMKSAEAKDQDHEELLDARRREKDALLNLVKSIENKQTIEFLTNEGLLPNYAFPESPVRLRSVVWKKKQHRSEKDRSAYETRTYEYARPAMAALGELAPENRFFAGGRHVTIDQVDVATSSLETWRFCDQCSHCVSVDLEDPNKDCPSCGSAAWGEESQKRQLLRLSQVFANTSDRASRIRDDQEERQPRHYNRNMLLTFQDQDREGAWRVDEASMPFAFEYLSRASFREFNFGEFTDQGSKFSIAGRDEVRKGFVICKHCGKVQPRERPGRQRGKDAPGPEHTLWCPARKKAAADQDFQAAVYLYREFASEALRMLLPLSEVSTERQLHSFVAAFQLGLRDKYGGRVDHLRTLVYSEPEPNSHLRRQYLVLYDTVPGGTGYLKDFTLARTEDGQEHPLFDILQRGLDRIRECTCSTDPERDGCYRCLFAYRNSRDMAETSAREAVELFGGILAHRDKLKPIESLSDVSVSGMMDSILEARFIEAFRRMDKPGRPVTVEKRMVRNKPGFRISVGEHVWNVEQQLELGHGDGFSPPVSIDFVFHSGSDSKREPIAIFLDGFQFHCDRVGKDMLQRMALLSTGSYDVWSFSWWDVDAAFHGDVEDAPFLLHPKRPELTGWLNRLGLGRWAALFDEPFFQLFVESLGRDPADSVPWSKLATASIIAQMSRPDEVDRSEWRDEVRAHSPIAAHPVFEAVEDDWLLVRRPAEDAESIGVWAAAPPSAVRDPSLIDDYRVLIWLDDSDERVETAEFRKTWRGFLRVFQFLGVLPHIWFVTRRGNDQLSFEPLLRLRSGPSDAGDEAWLGLDVSSSFVPVAEALAAEELPLPEAGIDLPDEHDFSCGIEGELVWMDARVAIVESRDKEGASPVADDWLVFEREEVLDDVGDVVAAITRRTEEAEHDASAAGDER
ncbi:MAG: DEAD/DEAH box helicase [Deltaproteobacteria bacterium]|nr:DEAD/DEAH box helicase [Deltaproteobacteria bacterium]